MTTLKTKTSRRAVLAGIPAAAAVAAVPVAATAAPTSIDAMLEGVDLKTREHIYGIVLGWMEALHDAKTGAPDPVFAAIEAYRKALRDIDAAFAPDADDEDAKEKANDAEEEALIDFFHTEPTTIAGALAALEFASSAGDMLNDVFERTNPDVHVAFTFWPKKIARNIRRIIESQAWFNAQMFGPLASRENAMKYLKA